MDSVPEERGRWDALTARAANVLFLALCVEVLFAVPYRTVHLATHSSAKAWIAGLLGLFCCVLISLVRHLLFDAARSLAGRVNGLIKAPLASLFAGLMLRLLWILSFHQPFTSDGAGYFQEATNLALHHSYGGPYWPPGFPLFLSPFFALFGATQLVAWTCALLLFTTTWLLVTRLADKLSAGQNGGLLAGWLLAVWPGYIAVSNINSKEMLLGSIVSGIMLLAFGTGHAAGGRKWLRTAASGILVGCAALTQPGFTLFPAVLLVSDWLRSRKLLPSLARSLVTVVMMLVVVLPWTARNYRAHHRYILISTNGGSVFYTANNARANASYSEEAQQALPADTIEADRIGYLLGKQWIREHPVDFATLGIRKQIVFLGDDGIGIYETLRRGRTTSGLLYNSLKGLCSVYWLSLWLVLFCCRRSLFHPGRWRDWFGIAFLPFLYQWAIDSVFESGSRHHIAYVGCLALVAAVALTRVLDPSWRRGDPGSYRLLTVI